MEAFAMACVLFLVFAILGLILLTVGIIFLLKNIKWKKEKETQGIKPTSNVLAIVGFSIMIFFGAMWMICFGAAAIAFFVLS